MNRCKAKILVGMLCALAGWSLVTQASSDAVMMSAQNTDELQSIEPGEGCYGALRNYLNQDQTQFDDNELVPGGTAVPPRRPAPQPPVQVSVPEQAPEQQTVAEPAPAPEPEVAPTPDVVPTGILATDDGSMDTAPTPEVTPDQQAQVDALEGDPDIQAIFDKHKDDDDDTALIAALLAAGIGAVLAGLLAKKMWDKHKKGQIKISGPTGFQKLTQPESKPTAPAKPPRPALATTPDKLPTGIKPPQKPVAPATPDDTAPAKPARPTSPVQAEPQGVQSSQAQKLQMLKAQQAQASSIQTASTVDMPKAQQGVLDAGPKVTAPQLGSAALNVKVVGGYKQDPVTKKWTRAVDTTPAPIKGGSTGFAEGPLAPSRPKPVTTPRVVRR